MFIFFMLLMFMFPANAADNQIIYVDISRVMMKEKEGTSENLNVLTFNYTNSTSTLEHTLNRHFSPGDFDKNILVYNQDNIKTLHNCTYITTPLKCGIENKHWTITTRVIVGDKYSTINLLLYNEEGIVIGHSSYTAWGTIRYVPRWKMTTITEHNVYGASKKQIFEQWPPKIQELPPLIKPAHVYQAVQMLYTSIKRFKE